MHRQPESEIMAVPARARAYAEADFADVNAAFVQRLSELATGVPEDAFVLDLGTGPGDIPRRLRETRPAWRIVAADASMPMLELARDGVGESATWIQADAGLLPFSDAAFDIVCSNSILHHVRDPARFWSELGRVARPGALLFHRDLTRPPSPAAARQIVAAHAAGEHSLLQEDFYNSLLAAYTPQEIREQLDTAGLPFLNVLQVTDRHVDIFGRA